MKLRRIVFWMHLTAGLVVGSVVLVMSVTGVLLAFERQLTELAERDLRVVPPEPGMPRLSIDGLISSVRAAEPEAMPSGLTRRSDPAAPVAISLGRERTVFLNPYTGVILGEGSKEVRGFFQSVENVHRWLGAPEQSRALGRGVTGACNLAFLFLVMSGFFLWWPRQGTKNGGRAILFPRTKLRGKARYFRWHNAIGFWCAPVLFFIVLSGILMSYPWATNLLYRVTGSELPPPRTAPAQRPATPQESRVVPADIDRLWNTAEQRVPGWKAISVRFETSDSAPLTFSIEQGQRGRPDLRSQLTLDSGTGEVVRWEKFSSFSLGRQLRSWGRFVHTGEAGGVLGQLIAAVAASGATVLVCTGFTLAWRRFRERKGRSETMRASETVELSS
ncbi:MAG: PepSY domain-containing protein [Verrucomicrobia bacterium]|nr:MAG: PepSY domain-containing protein [Verrucomicrobiota bacterium]